MRLIILFLCFTANLSFSQTVVHNTPTVLLHLFETNPDIDTLYISYSENPRPLAKEIGLFKNLKFLVCNESITDIPIELYNLSKLELLSLQHNTLDSLPVGINKLSSLKVLDLMDTKIKYLPDDICELDSLTTLNLSITCITSIPQSIWKLQKLSKISFCLRNFESFPYELAKIHSLTMIDTRVCSFNDDCVKKSELFEKTDAFRKWLKDSLPTCKVY
ncbi:MAG: hypothetical protein R3D00_21940 [Bacteroidia bacterium]